MFYANILLLTITFFWGITFVIVKESVRQIGVFPFLVQRFFFSSLLLAPLAFLRKKSLKLITIKDGTVLGVLLFGGYTFQTTALLYTTASNTAFLTGLNVVFVPLIITLLLKQKISHQVKVGVFFAMIGLYLLCTVNSLTLNAGDLWAIAGALCIALHIIFTGRYSHRNDTVLLATIQLVIITFLSFGMADLRGEIAFGWYPEVIWEILFCAIFATCLAFLIQTSMQRYTSPTQTSLIFSMEPVFAAIYAYIVINERLGYRGILGATLVFSGMIISQYTSREYRKMGQ